jgi:hypothetical protein
MNPVWKLPSLAQRGFSSSAQRQPSAHSTGPVGESLAKEKLFYQFPSPRSWNNLGGRCGSYDLNFPVQDKHLGREELTVGAIIESASPEDLIVVKDYGSIGLCSNTVMFRENVRITISSLRVEPEARATSQTPN